MPTVAQRCGIELSKTPPYSHRIRCWHAAVCRIIRPTDWTCLLGATTENGDRFFARFEEYVTAEHAKHIILVLYKELEDGLLIVLDGAPYFQASAVTDLAARDELAFVTLPAYSPELNPVEECWRQLQAALSNHFFESLGVLPTAIDTALDQTSIPEVSYYF